MTCRKMQSRYRPLSCGYSICLVSLKLFEPIYAPLIAGLLRPFPGDSTLQPQRQRQLDRLYQRVVDRVVAHGNILRLTFVDYRLETEGVRGEFSANFSGTSV